MQQKSYMNWQTAGCLATFITLMFVLPLFSPLYLKTMGGEMFGFIGSVPKYVSLLYGTGNFFMLTFLIFVFDFQVLKKETVALKRNTYLIGGVSLITILFSLLQLAVYNILFTSGGEWSIFSGIFGAILLTNLSLALTAVSISYIIYLSEKRQLLALQYESLKVENMQIRYQALKNQVDPHFLFNTMSILDSLVDEDRQRTHEYIQRFSSVYRYILQTKETVTIDEELRFIDDYFGLLQVRFGEDLTLAIDVKPNLKSCCIVPLGLQTLVENAVQHNVISRQHPLHITIYTSDDQNVTVSNNYQPKNVLTGSGIGLANLSERCMLRWQTEISIEQTDDTFRVTIPLVRESHKNK